MEMHMGRTGSPEARLGIHRTFVSGLFVVVVASTRVLALVPWGGGLYEAPAIEHKACPPMMGSESLCLSATRHQEAWVWSLE